MQKELDEQEQVAIHLSRKDVAILINELEDYELEHSNYPHFDSEVLWKIKNELFRIDHEN